MLPMGSQVGGVNLDLEEKLELVKRNTQEIVTVEELRNPVSYTHLTLPTILLV